MKKIYGFAVAAATMMLASCSSDAPEVIDNPVKGEVAGYIKMNLPEGTRAAGDKVIFYKNNTQISATPTDVDDVWELNAIPDQVVVFRGDKGLTDSKSATTTSKNGYSSATHSDGTYRTAITTANISHSKTDFGTAQPVNVYLDPVVASVKVKCSATGDKINMNEVQVNDYTITFVPEYAFVNGVATKTTHIKGMPTLGATNTTIQGVAVPNTALGYGTGSHWTANDYIWNTDDVEHYALTGGGSKAQKGLDNNAVNIFERAPQTAKTAKKEYTHIIVAGKYNLTGATLPDNFDGTFWTYGTTNGKPNVYLTEAAVKAAMGNANGTLEAQTTTTGGMTTHYTMNGETCLKYDKGYVYYAAVVETKIGTQLIGKGVVRNHAYTIDVTQISGWGNAIANTDEPIIPEDGPKGNESSYLKLNITINPMVNVEGQEVKW